MSNVACELAVYEAMPSAMTSAMSKVETTNAELAKKGSLIDAELAQKTSSAPDARRHRAQFTNAKLANEVMIIDVELGKVAHLIDAKNAEKR